jgi:hypothetical protein
MYLGSRAWLVRKAYNLTAICEPIAWTSHKSLGLDDLLPGYLFFCHVDMCQ